MNEKLYHKINLINQMIEHKAKINQSQYNSLSRGQGRIMLILKAKEGLSSKDLSIILGTSVTSVNSLLNKLEKKGFIIKVPSRKDKRVLIINLTEKGKAYEIKPPVDYELFDCFNQDEKENLDNYFDSIINELRKAIKEENPEKFSETYAKRKEFLKEMLNTDDDSMYWFNLIYGEN